MMKQDKSKERLEDIRKIYRNPILIGKLLGDAFNKLNKVHNEWIKTIWYGEHKNDLLLSAHRGSYKTTSVISIGIVHYLLFNPTKRVALITAEHTRAMKLFNTIRNIFKNKKIVEIYNIIHGKNEEHILKDLGDTRSYVRLLDNDHNEHSLECFGLNTIKLTGTHFDKIHCDDLVTMKDMVEPEKRKKVLTLYTDFRNIISNQNSITLTGTPYHINDLYNTIDCDKITCNINESPVYRTKEEKEKIKEKILKSAHGDYIWRTQYLCEYDKDEDPVFYKDFVFEDKPKSYAISQGHIDLSFTGKDYTAMTKIWKIRGKYYVLGKIIKSILNNYDIASEYFKDCETLYCEDNNGGPIFETYMYDKYAMNVSLYHEKDNKHFKIGDLKRFWKDIVFIKGTDGEYISQIKNYQKGIDHDDAPDSLVSLLRRAYFEDVNEDPQYQEYIKNSRDYEQGLGVTEGLRDLAI